MDNYKKESLYLQISAGRGPVECCWVVAQLFNKIIDYITQNNLKYEVLEKQEGYESKTYNSILMKINGKGLNGMREEWEGSIQWVAQSPFRKNHKRKNWFVGVSFFNEEAQLKFNVNDLEFQTFRASGPGGQHRNKVETAVRVIHTPTGFSVTASDSKSQLQNKKNAIRKMEETFKQNVLATIQNQLNEHWKSHLSLERGNPIKVFKNQC